MRRVLLVIWIVVGAGALDAADPAERPTTVDEETGKQYNEFREWLTQRIERVVPRMASRYALRAEQQEAARRLVRDSADVFLREHGWRAFEFFQRARSLRGFMRAEQLGWQDVPEDIRQDLAERALPLIGEMEKRMSGFADDFAKLLDSEQRKRLREDRQRVERGLRFVRLQARVMSGRPVLDGGTGGQPATRAAGAAMEPRRQTRRASLGGAGLDRWERYVEEFIRRHRLDEVQKVRAMDLLKKYKGKARQLSEKAERRAATQPARGHESVADFRRRLSRLRAQRRPIRQLFEQLKAELDKIPSPVQRKLAEESPPAPRAGVVRRGDRSAGKGDQK